MNETLVRYSDKEPSRVLISNVTIRYTNLQMACIDQKQRRLTHLVALMLRRPLKSVRMVTVTFLGEGSSLVVNILYQILSHTDSGHAEVFAPAVRHLPS